MRVCQVAEKLPVAAVHVCMHVSMHARACVGVYTHATHTLSLSNARARASCICYLVINLFLAIIVICLNTFSSSINVSYVELSYV